MKKILLLLIPVTLLTLFSCNKDDNFRSFKDFDYTTVYFPYQYPVRTLILGDYTLADNTNDNNLTFMISARVGGMYQNKSDWKVSFAMAETLVQNLATSLGDTIELLPSKYYTLNDKKEDLVIPKGKFYGEIPVQLTDAFLDDSMSYRTHYAIPLRITTSTTDSVLVGVPIFSDADPRIATQWGIVPKDFTIFGIKYINKYSGKYLHRGISIIKDGTDTPIDTVVYHQRYVEQDEVWYLRTTGRNKVSVQGVLRANTGSPGNFNMDIVFDNSGKGVISRSAGGIFDVLGTAIFFKDGDEWGNQKRDAIYLSYKIAEGANIHYITDTLVFRDKAVAFEQFVPEVLE